MSTFDGYVKEFPDIRIDYFRPSAVDYNGRAPLAYFLSHVHSDHLVGLESCKSPFIYCSAATREILLRLEKYPHRMNFARGILETRKQTYRHLKHLLKHMPLETPTVLELAPGRSIRVTLFDANHCVGAVMFLIEGDGKTVLYTGDVRCEPWWVDNLKRQPLLVPYLSSSERTRLRTLDAIYLDTSFCNKRDSCSHFPSKADGLAELLRKIAQYPDDTLFYFDAWTFGYESVWHTLSSFLNCQIHLDKYRYGLYSSLANGDEPKAPEANALTGYYCGNHFQPGCLTSHQSRLHSCEKGSGCDIWERDFVRITPVISRHQGMDMAEVGAGDGNGDLNQRHELETSDDAIMDQLIALCASKLQGQPEPLSRVLKLLTAVIDTHAQCPAVDALGQKDDEPDVDSEDISDLHEVPIEKIVSSLTRLVMRSEHKVATNRERFATSSPKQRHSRSDGLPTRITFPYSRHSSYEELCLLIEVFLPRDIHPCTVDSANWTSADSMASMFGHLYDRRPCFSHDQMMFNRTKRSGKNWLSSSVSKSPTDPMESTDEKEPNSPTAGRPRSAKRKRRTRLDGGVVLIDQARGRIIASDSAHLGGDTPFMAASNRAFQRRSSQPELDSKDGSKPGSSCTGRQKQAAINTGSVEDGRTRRTVLMHAPPESGASRRENGIPSSSLIASGTRSPRAWSSLETSMAVRTEAWNAAVGADGIDWSAITLVSVRPHTKEEEL